MATSAQEHLDLINQVITKRLRGDAYETYSEAAQRFEGTPLKELYAIREQLEKEVAAAGSGQFRLARPFKP